MNNSISIIKWPRGQYARQALRLFASWLGSIEVNEPNSYYATDIELEIPFLFLRDPNDGEMKKKERIKRFSGSASSYVASIFSDRLAHVGCPPDEAS